ncbi:LOW QUALITY PROTEIN: WD repeat-containing protein 88 [Spheniscus humboldti]
MNPTTALHGSSSEFVPLKLRRRFGRSTAGSSRGDPLALGPPPEPKPSPAEGRWGEREPMAQFLLSYSLSWTKLSKIVSRKNTPKLCCVPLQIQFQILRGHSDTMSTCHFCFEDTIFAEDTKILSCSYDRTVELWVCYEHNNKLKKKPYKALPNQTHLDLFKDVEKGFPIQVSEFLPPISECNLTPDDRRVVTSYDNTAKAWGMETGKMLWTVEHEGIVTSCSISCDGRYMVSGSDKENTIYVFDAIISLDVFCIGHHKSTITRCCFDPDNQRVTSVSYDKTIKLWDMITRSTSITINEGHSNAVSDCCFTSDSHYLCTASWDKSLKIWDINTGEFRCHEPISLNQGHEGSVSSCLFSQDTSLVSGGYDKTIAIWDTEAGYKKLSLKGHWDWVTDVAISKKWWILSASKDSTLSWNIEKTDHIPSVIESRKERGSKIAQCEEREKPFLRLQCSDSQMISKCVFCYLSSPVRKILPLPPSVSPDL